MAGQCEYGNETARSATDSRPADEMVPKRDGQGRGLLIRGAWRTARMGKTGASGSCVREGGGVGDNIKVSDKEGGVVIGEICVLVIGHELILISVSAGLMFTCSDGPLKDLAWVGDCKIVYGTSISLCV